MIDLAKMRSVVDGDPSINEKLKTATTVDEAVAVLNDGGFTISKADFLRAQARQLLECSDEELDAAPAAMSYTTDTLIGCVTWVAGCCG